MKTAFPSRGILFFLLLMGVFAGATGCIKIDASLSLNRDGSGSLRTIYGMPTFLIKQMELTRQWTRSLDFAGGQSTNMPLPSLDLPMIFDEAVLNSRFRQMMADGVILESLRTREQGGWRYVDFNLKFSRFDGLVKQSFFEQCGVVWVRAEDDTCKLLVSLPPVGVSPNLSVQTSPGASANLTPYMNGLRVVVRIDLPGEIRNSSSTMSDNRRATWEWDFDKDAAVIERLTKDRIIVVFDGRQVRFHDFEKPAGGTAFRIK
jgi:hypothetical protein